MLTLVLIVNGCLALLCLMAAWQLWKLRRRIRRAANTLIAVERRTDAILRGAPNFILQGQKGSQALQVRYQRLEQQLQQVQKVLGLLRLGQGIWLRRRLLR